MEKRTLGKTGLSVTSGSLGTMDVRYLDEANVARLFNAALDRGVNYIDTSPEYPMAEYYIGKTIAHRRDEYVLATKCGDNMTGVGATYIFDRKTIISNLEESLRLMKTDYVDVLQLHGVTPELLEGGCYGEAMETMRELKASGKALHLGLTVRNGNNQQYGYPAVFGYNSLPRFAQWDDIEMAQIVYGGLTRMSENMIQKVHDEYNTGIVVRGVAKQYDSLYPARYEASRISELFEEGETRNDFLIRYALSHPAISSLVIGTKNIEHLMEDLDAVEKGPLCQEVYEEAKRRLNFAGVIAGPTDMKLDW